SPPPVGAVVPVAVGTAVEEQDDGRPTAERPQRVEERLAEELRRPGVVAVQQDERPVAVPRRDDADLAEVLPDVAAVQREADKPRAARRVVARAAATGRENDDRG